jgi:hypothetical protein
MPFKFELDEFLAHPVLASLLIVDIGVLMFTPLVRPPVILNMLFVGGLVYLCLYFGARLAVRE